jgi:CheY-like chemotaxis protein
MGQKTKYQLQKELHVACPRPNLILLDLTLPRKNRGEVLAEIKADTNLVRIPVVMRTTSNAEADILHSYNLHTHCEVAKPVEFESLLNAEGHPLTWVQWGDSATRGIA